MNDSYLKMSLIGIPCDFMYKIITFKFSKPRLSPFWKLLSENLLAIFHLFFPLSSLHVNTHMHIYIHICVCIYTHIHSHTHMHMYMHAHICTHAPTRACTHTCMLTHVHVCYVPVCTCAYVWTCTYICAHIHTQPKTLSQQHAVGDRTTLPSPPHFSLYITDKDQALGQLRRNGEGIYFWRTPAQESKNKTVWKSSNSSLNNHHSP